MIVAGKWLACQSMDNKVVIFSAMNRFKLNRKKTFTGKFFLYCPNYMKTD